MFERSIIAPKHQQGAALIVSLALLLIMTIIGIAAVESVSLQSQMAINSQMRQDVFNIALTNIDEYLYDPMRTNDPTNDMSFASATAGTTRDISSSIALSPTGVTTTMNITARADEHIACEAGTIDERKRIQFDLESAASTATKTASDQIQGFAFCVMVP